MSESESRYIAEVAARRAVRPSVRSLIVQEGRVLVQRPSDSEPGHHYGFIGGGYEIGDTFESRLRKEIEEETNARLVDWEYLFVVENRFVDAGRRVHAVEHYLLATIDRTDVVSREAHLVQEWIPLSALAATDVRPHAVRDVLATGRHHEIRHLTVNAWPE
ncbi:NUDIX domain-containing protein [Actinomadura sp. 9N407]|uniref:NUDIX domain-containing protein n=1 Tax=Actinomadura sp. 9N407 TaxID=3375154 RepID=UPI003796ACD9